MTSPDVAICIGLSGTHVLIWNPFAGGCFCDRVDSQDCMLDEADPLFEGAVVPRPSALVSAARLIDTQRLEHLPLLYAGETPVTAETRLTPAQQRAVDRGGLTEDVARRLAV
ncbi:hypothetical protein [Amycolatopsis viridis]|uniref:Uncharacterized protein n=1 Tax=Amycolatopsis viridis TaxID=185678 RepID=A0ABX0STY5_9PSEU|nr:hypothetical protein [Amycolatopsis viridis]NIH80412.1 hypothetical protein [Amycolatopsis viridis]